MPDRKIRVLIVDDSKMIRQMITKLGMSKELGTVYLGSDQEVFVGMEFGQSREYSEEVAARIDNEISRIMSECYQVAMDKLNTHIDDLHGLADLLVEKETVTREEFVAFINRNNKPAKLTEDDAEADQPAELPEGQI